MHQDAYEYTRNSRVKEKTIAISIVSAQFMTSHLSSIQSLSGAQNKYPLSLCINKISGLFVKKLPFNDDAFILFSFLLIRRKK
jgi:hypothetical protein